MKFVNSFNHYRAIAIILIVAVHSRTISDLSTNTFVERFIVNSISGATINFTFISGFLFYLVVYNRYDFVTYVKSRFNQFIKPYVVLSILPIAICLVTLPNYWDNSSILRIIGDNPNVSSFISVLKYIVSGAHITAYWYIPFAMLLALISPLYIAFIKFLNLKWQLIVFFILLIIASIVQRPYTRLDVFQSAHMLIYLLPSFLFGIICAMHKEEIYAKVKGKEFYLLAIAIFFILLQLYLGDIGLYKKSEIFSFNGIDLIVFKMTFLCLFFMVWLHRFEHINNSLINKLASSSFAVYFLHVYVLRFITVVKGYFGVKFESNLLVYFIGIAIIVFLSSFIAIIVNRMFPRYSRYLIGYGKKDQVVSEKKIFSAMGFKIIKLFYRLRV